MLPVRGGERFLRGVFEPLGYEVEAVRYPLDERFPDWGESPYFSVAVRKTTTLADLLTHLYVLIPVFDSRKHYLVGDDEMEKLLAKGEGWLADHPGEGRDRPPLSASFSRAFTAWPSLASSKRKSREKATRMNSDPRRRPKKPWKSRSA